MCEPSQWVVSILGMVALKFGLAPFLFPVSPEQPQNKRGITCWPLGCSLCFVTEQLLAGLFHPPEEMQLLGCLLVLPGRFSSGNPPPAAAQWLGALQGEQQPGKTNIILLEHISTGARI